MNEKENNPLHSEPGNFGLPGDYFQKSAGSIFNKIEWQEEHRDLPKIVQHKNKNVFAVPAGYFDKKEHALELVGFSHLAAVTKQSPFTLPATYFEDAEVALFTENLIASENELQPFEKLSEIVKRNNFKTAEHYFNDNREKLAALLRPEKPAKVIRLLSAKNMYAAAALLVIALGFWAYSSYFKPVEAEDCGTIACIDRVDLMRTKTLENLDNEELYEIVNTKKLEEHLNSGGGKPGDNIKTDSSSKNEIPDDMLDEI